MVNQGQLKHFTQKAVEEMNTRLPGGAGPELNNLVQSWKDAYATQNYGSENPDPADFQAIATGQLKWIAQKVHERLINARYEDHAPTWLTPDPTSDKQLANLGQLKTIFAFELQAPEGQIPDWWQRFYYDRTNLDPNARADDPNDSDQNQDYDGNIGAPTFLEIYQQTNDPLAFYTIRKGGGIQSRTLTANSSGLRVSDPHLNYSFASATFTTKSGIPRGGALLIDPLPHFPPLNDTWPYKIIPANLMQNLLKDRYSDFLQAVTDFDLSEARWEDYCYQYDTTADSRRSQPLLGPYSFGITRTDYRLNINSPAPIEGYQKTLYITKGLFFYSTNDYVDLPNNQPPYVALNLNVSAGKTEGTPVRGPAEDPGNNYRFDYTPVQVTELSPKIKNDDGIDIPGSEKPSLYPLTPLVEIDPFVNRIAHREMIVSIGRAFAGKKVTWSFSPVPNAIPAGIRGQWSEAHPDRFERATAYDAYGFRRISQEQGETIVGTAGATAIRVNVPPVGFNKVIVSIRVEGIDADINLIDLEVPAIVVIDPGHGGPDPGNSLTTVNPKLYERDLNFLYATEIKNTLKRKILEQGRNCKVKVGKQSNLNGSKFANGDRPAQAKNLGADINLALHFNGGEEPAAGTQVYIIAENQQNVNYSQDRALAVRMYEAGKSVFGAGNRSAGQTIIDLGTTADGRVFLRDNLLGNEAEQAGQGTFVRAALLELEYLNNAAVANKLSGPNATATMQDYALKASQAIIEDLLNQPQL